MVAKKMSRRSSKKPNWYEEIILLFKIPMMTLFIIMLSGNIVDWFNYEEPKKLTKEDVKALNKILGIKEIK